MTVAENTAILFMSISEQNTMTSRYLSKPARLQLMVAALVAVCAVVSGPLHAQQSSSLSDDKLNNLIDTALACDNAADATEDPSTRFAAKIRCYDELIPHGDLVPEVMESITYYEERLSEFLGKKNSATKAHPHQGAYQAMRGYTSAGRPSPNKECKDVYGPFDVFVDDDGVAEFSIGERRLRGIVDKTGVLTLNGRKTSQVGKKKIGLISGKKFNSRFTIEGPLTDAVMVSGYCKDGYFRAERN